MAPKRSLKTEAELNEAVDSLLSAFALPDEVAEGETGFEGEAKPKLDDGEKKGGVAPSGDVGSLWGESKPRKR